MPEARLTVWGEAECRRLHEATLELLADTGVEVRYEPALALFQRRRRLGGRPSRAHPGAARRRGARERAARVAGQAARRRDASRSSCATARSTSAPARTACTSATPTRDERRRVRRADVEGMAALCEKLPNIDFVMTHGPARGRAAGDRRPGPGRRHAARHAQAAAGGAARRHACSRACRRWRRSAARRRASPSTPCRRRRCMHDAGRAHQGDRLRRAADPADLRAGAVHGVHRRRAASPAPCSSATPRCSAAWCCTSTCGPARRSSTAPAAAPWTCAP